MKKYFKNNITLLLILLLLVIVSGPLCSFIIGFVVKYLNPNLGDWLSFYGSIAGIVISLIVIHLQLSIEEENERSKYRPELVLSNDYQLIKSGCRVYFDDKHWFRLLKDNNPNLYVSSNSFEATYSEENKRDKILSLEIVNNQPIFNIRIIFGADGDSELIPKLDVGHRIYVVSKAHQKEIHTHLLTEEKALFKHVPSILTIYFTTLSGEFCKYIYDVNEKGYFKLNKKCFGIDYPEISEENHICDYFDSK